MEVVDGASEEEEIQEPAITVMVSNIPCADFVLTKPMLWCISELLLIQQETAFLQAGCVNVQNKSYVTKPVFAANITWRSKEIGGLKCICHKRNMGTAIADPMMKMLVPLAAFESLPKTSLL